MTKHKQASLIIIGGGPAGCAAALGALKEGWSDITVIEKEPKDRHRIGEILLTQTILELKELGIHKEIHECGERFGWGKKYAAAYVHGKDRTPWRVQNNHPLTHSEDQSHIPKEYINPETGLWYTYMVRRHEFDESLRSICQSKGVKFIHGKVKKIHWINEDSAEETFVSKIEVEEETKSTLTIRPKFIIDATGQNAVLARSMNQRLKLEDWNLQARYTYFKNVDFEKAMNHGFFKEGANILSYKDGWVWIANLGNDMTSVGIVSQMWNQQEESFYEKLTHLPEYKTFGFDQAKVVDCYGNPAHPKHFYAHHNYRYRSTKMRGLNWVCAGDAAMFLDPLLSQGVTLALSFGAQAGKTAARIINGQWEATEALRKYENMYVSEIEVLNKVVSLWYKPDFSFKDSWAKTANKINRIFGREIKSDVESFRWVSNLENIHQIIKDKHDGAFIKDLEKVNTIKMVHQFESSGLIKI